MSRIVRLTESDLQRIVKRAIQESNRKKRRTNEEVENFFNPEALSTGEAIVTMVTTILGLLGIAGSHYIKGMIDKLRKKGEDDKADEVERALMDARNGMGGMRNNDMGDEIDEEGMSTVGDF
jgi:hypothetical protein